MKNILSFAALSGLLSVGFGAFGAHGLKPVLSLEMLNTYETAVKYQFYHTLAIILVVLLYQSKPTKTLQQSAYLFFAGILLFSGSLYALVLSSIGGETMRWLGAITPFGGICFIVGWGLLFIGARKAF